MKVVRRAVAGDNPAMAPPNIIIPKSLLKQISQPADETPEEPEQRFTTQPHTSFSQMSMYLRCPAQYRFRYVLGLKERPKVSLSIGKGGHAALEFNTKTKLRTGEDAPTEAVLDKASDMMDHYLREMPLSEYEKDVEPGSTKDKFIAATKIYRVRDAEKIKPIGAEIEFNLDINEFIRHDEEPIRIVNGKIDLVYDDYPTIVAPPEILRVGVEDYKYVSKKKSQNEVDLTPQLTLYGAVIHKLTDKWPNKLGLRLMHSGTKADGPDSIVMLRDQSMMTPEKMERRLARLAAQFLHVERGIRNEVFPITDNPITCSWCGYRERCQDSLVDDIEAATIRANTTPR